MSYTVYKAYNKIMERLILYYFYDLLMKTFSFLENFILYFELYNVCMYVN